MGWVKRFKFIYYDANTIIEAYDIFDAMVTFHALYKDAKLDIESFAGSRFDEISHLTIEQL